MTIFVDRGEERHPDLTREQAGYFRVVRREKGVRYGDVLDCVRVAMELEGGMERVVGEALDFEGLVFAETVEEWREAERQAWVWEDGERKKAREREEEAESWAECDAEFAPWMAYWGRS